MDGTILSVIGTGIGVAAFIYTLLRNFKADVIKELVEIKEDIKEIHTEIKEINYRVSSIDQRLSRLEGIEIGHWEGRMYSMQRNITEENK